MSEDDGLLHAFRLDGEGGGAALDWDQLEEARSRRETTWVHLNRSGARTRGWLTRTAGLPELAADALLAEETRPRAQRFGDGLLLILRGVNLNPGADPDDMVSLRLWVERDRAISVRLRRLMAVQDLVAALGEGRGPRGLGDFLPMLVDGLTERMGGVVLDMEEELDALEEAVATGAQADLRARLHRERHKAIGLRRYVAPQREALGRVLAEPPDWLRAGDRERLREQQDRVTRYVEALDEVRERASVIQDELATRLAEQLNQRMYVLSIVAAVFLPLGFLTGLLGINVGGIPGAETPWAFAAVTLALTGVAVGLVVLFRRLRWL